MLATRNETLDPLAVLRQEMDDWMERLFGSTFGGLAPELRAFPAMNIWETDDALWVEAEVPGVRMEDLDILLNGKELAIRGKAVQEEVEGIYHRRERGTGEFRRVVHLPVEVEPDQVEAHIKNGVLTIKMLKAAEVRPRRIEVKTAS